MKTKELLELIEESMEILEKHEKHLKFREKILKILDKIDSEYNQDLEEKKDELLQNVNQYVDSYIKYEDRKKLFCYFSEINRLETLLDQDITLLNMMKNVSNKKSFLKAIKDETFLISNKEYTIEKINAVANNAIENFCLKNIYENFDCLAKNYSDINELNEGDIYKIERKNIDMINKMLELAGIEDVCFKDILQIFRKDIFVMNKIKLYEYRLIKKSQNGELTKKDIFNFLLNIIDSNIFYYPLPAYKKILEVVNEIMRDNGMNTKEFII